MSDNCIIKNIPPETLHLTSLPQITEYVQYSDHCQVKSIFWFKIF